MRLQNLILFLIICLLAGGAIFFEKIDPKSKITFDVLDLFPSNKDRAIIEIYRKIGDTNTILVAKDHQILDQEFDAFLNEVRSLPQVKEIVTNNSLNLRFRDFITQNYFYLGNFRPSTLSAQEIEQKILKDFSQDTLNPIDPLGLIHIPDIGSQLQVQNLPLIIIKLKDINAQDIYKLYEKFSSLAQTFGITHYFSPSFVNVVNPQFAIQEVNYLGGIALAFFALLYLLILRMPFLTLNSLLTILFSNVIAIFSLISFYPQVSIMSLSFGIGISNICIDYMLHHHFLGYYQLRKVKFNQPVFYGFITTLVGFLICLFIPFPLLNQLSLYAIVNLSVAYLCFAFLYQKIGFSSPKYYTLINKFHIPLFPSWLLLIFSLSLGGYALTQAQRDFDLSKLDYQNKDFENQKEFFASLYSKELFLIQAPTINALIGEAKQISKISQENLGILSILPTQKEIRTRQRYFKSFSFADQKNKLKQAIYRIQKNNPELAQMLKDTYRSFPKTFSQITLTDLQSLGLDVLQYNGQFYIQGSLPDVSKIAQFYNVITQQPQSLMQEITNSVYAPMISILALAFIAVIAVLAVISGTRIIDSLGFVTLPLACTLFYLSSMHIPINIMHLFAMLLIVVVSIDYGIYHIKEKDDIQAKHAILFSTLTTLCSFGIFLFSNTKALRSFGEVVMIGMICILFLIFFQKDLKKA